MIIAILSPHLISVLIIPCIRCLRTRKAKKMIFQKDLNNLYTPPEFKISFNYGIALNILFVSITFSAGMPLLYITAFASYVSITICEKYIGKFLKKGTFLITLDSRKKLPKTTRL